MMGSKRSNRHREENEEDSGYRFKVVLFLDDQQEKLSIDIAPKEWIFYSEESKTNICRFPVGPFSNEEISDLHKKVRNCHLADKSWPLHRVEIRGRARTYSEACDAAEKLQFDRYAFSTDRESSVERALRDENEPPRCRDLSHKTLDEELDEATVVLSDDPVMLNKEKARSTLKNKKGRKQNFPPQHPFNSSDSSSSDESTSQGQKKRGVSTSKTSMKQDGESSDASLDSSPDESPPGNPKSTSPKKKKEKSQSLYDSEKSRNISSSESRKSSQKQNNMLSKNSVTSPRLSITPSLSGSGKSSEEHLDSSTCLKGRGPEVLFSKRLPSSKNIFQSPMRSHSLTPNTSKRNHSEMQESSPEVNNEKQIDKKTKNDRRSRSKERNFHGDSETLKSIPDLHQQLSTRMRISRRSSSAEIPRKTQDREREKRARSSDVNSSRHIVTNSARVEMILPTVEENDNNESLRAYMKSIYQSLSNKLDRLHGSHVEIMGKLDRLINTVQKDSPTQEDSDDGNDANDPDALILPLDTLEKFHSFDAKIKDDKEYRMKIKKRIKNMVPQPTIPYATRNLSVIVRTFLTKKLVTENFVALKKTATKHALKDTNLYKCFLDVHLRVLGDQMNEKKFNDFLKNMFNSAGDWDGGRFGRSKN